MTHAAAKTERGLSPLNIAAIVSGNALEFYDFMTFAFFAPQIARALFPGEGTENLLFTLFAFGVGFLTRPLGGLVLGSYADRVGRKPAMLLSFTLMGLSTLGIVFVPPFAVIGHAAPALAIALRLLGGFALGGEVGPNTAYLLEAAPLNHRGLYVSFQYATQQLAILLSGLVGLLLAANLSAQDMDMWGWRVAFLLGALLLPFGIFLRHRLREEALIKEDHAPSQPINSLRSVAVAAFFLFGGTTICVFAVDYMTTYAQVTLKLETTQAFIATAIIGAAGACADIAGGWLSDRFGRKRAMLPPLVFLLLVTIPAFSLLSFERSGVMLYSVAALLAILVGLWITPAMVLISEALPAARRATGLALVYAIATSTFGGSTQVVVAWLGDATKSALAPAWYMTGAVSIAFAASFLVRDGYRAKMSARPYAIHQKGRDSWYIPE